MPEGQPARSPRTTLAGIPAVYVLLFADLLRDLGYDDAALLAELGLVRSSLLAPDARVAMSDAARLAERGLALAGHEGLGFRYAAAMKITLHGPVGLLALSSATIRDAVDAATRFIAIRAPFLEFHWEKSGDHLELSIEPNRDLGRHRAFVMELMTASLAYMIEQLDPSALSDAEIHLTGPEPPYYRRLARSLPVRVRYDEPECVVRGSAALLDRRPYLADPKVAALAREQCEAEMQKLFPPDDSIAAKVARLVAAEPVGAPSIDAIAKAMHVSSRTLRRRLAEASVSYTDVVDDVMRERATRLLRETELTIADVAFRAGYSDVSNFGRAVRRWTGKTPKAFRDER